MAKTKRATTRRSQQRLASRRALREQTSQVSMGPTVNALAAVVDKLEAAQRRFEGDLITRSKLASAIGVLKFFKTGCQAFCGDKATLHFRFK